MAAPFNIVTPSTATTRCSTTIASWQSSGIISNRRLARNRDRYFEIFEALHRQLGYADYLEALQRYRRGANNDPRLSKCLAFWWGRRLIVEHIGDLVDCDVFTLLGKPGG